MHNHDDNGEGTKSMMWMMALCCAVPLIFIFIFGVGGEALGAPVWIVFGGIALMAIFHLFIMKRSHKNYGDGGHKTTGNDKNEDNKDEKTHSGHGCCH